MRHEWRVMDQNGNTLRVVTLEAGVEPQLATYEPQYDGGGMMMVGGWTERAEIIRTIDEDAERLAAAASLLSELQGKAERAVSSINNSPDVAAVSLKRTRGATLTTAEKEIITSAENQVVQIRNDLATLTQQLQPPAGTEGVVIPDWARD